MSAVFHKRDKTGFTLVELMISMSIIAILAVVLSISFSKAQKDGRDQRRIGDLKSIQNAAEQYFLLTGAYPASAGSWSVGTQVVLQKFPTGPKGDTYVYRIGADGVYYVCSSHMESGKYGNAALYNDYFEFQTLGVDHCIKGQQ